MANNQLESSSLMRILVGEDDPLVAQVIEIAARKAEIVVEHVANGLDAADRVAASPPDHFDAVLLDMRMPILDGREAARRIRDLPYARGAIPIYAMSSSETELLRHPWATWLFDGHLTKPLKQSDLLALLRDHSRKSSGRQAKPVDRRHREAIVERIENGMREIDDAVAQADCEKAGDAAKRLRLALLGLAPEDLIRALHLFQLSQVHGRGEREPLEDLRQCFVTARTLLMTT
jgi:CheY-like chemotaxis protein